MKWGIDGEPFSKFNGIMSCSLVSSRVRFGGVHTMQPARSPYEVWTPDDFCESSSRNAKSSVYVSVSTDIGKSFKWSVYHLSPSIEEFYQHNEKYSKLIFI